jgi:branched-chain amino acid aminotransferase
LNGKFVDENDAGVSLRDTGLLHAAGVFTTMRSYRGRVYRIGEHLKRVRASCDTLFVPLNFKDEDLIDATHELLKRNQLTESRLRLTITRGHAIDDPLHGMRLEPNAFITATNLEPYPSEFYERGMTVVLLDEQKLNPFDIQAGHKTLNYFSRLAGLKSANRAGAGEALWFNVYYNSLQSGSVTNVFMVKDGVLITPPTNDDLRDPTIKAATPFPKSCVLPGITRAVVLDLARQNNIPTRLAAIDVNQLLAADEVFLTNSIMQIMPVCRIEKHAVGNDKPGEMTLRLTQLYRDSVDAETLA